MNKPTLADQLGHSLPIISSTARTAFVAAHFILALGSGFAIMYLVIGAVEERLSPWLAYLLAWAGSLVWYRAIENPLRKFILFAWAYKLTDQQERKELSKNLQRTGRASGWVTLILLAVTLSLSLLINVDVSDAITSEKESNVEIEQSSQVTSSYNRDVDILRDQVTAAQIQDAAMVQEAKKDAAEWIVQAQNSKGPEMRRLAASGNSWAVLELRGAINRATSRGDKHIKAAKASASTPTLQAELTTYLRTRSSARDTVATMAASLVAGRHAEYLGTKGRRNWMLFGAVLSVLIVFIWTARLLVLACLETGESLEDQEPGEGIAKVASRLAGKLNAKLAQRLDQSFGDKLVLAIVQRAEPISLKPSVAPPKPSVPPPAPTPIAATKPSAKPSVIVAVSVGVSVSKLGVVFDGVTYTPAAAMDKMRKWYSHSKTAKKEGTQIKNRQKYLAAKNGTADYFTFTERAKSVKIHQK
jgi:hypothetical protein